MARQKGRMFDERSANLTGRQLRKIWTAANEAAVRAYDMGDDAKMRRLGKAAQRAEEKVTHGGRWLEERSPKRRRS